MNFKEKAMLILGRAEDNLNCLGNIIADNEMKEQLLSSTGAMEILEDGYEVCNKLRELLLEEDDEVDYAN